jgi:hypothetical protein
MIEAKLPSESFIVPPQGTIPVHLEWKYSRKKHVSFDVTLLWFTHGKGIPERGIVANQSFSTQKPEGNRQFYFEAPSVPQSFQGVLFSVKWAIEIRSTFDEFLRLELDISPYSTPATTVF